MSFTFFSLSCTTLEFSNNFVFSVREFSAICCYNILKLSTNFVLSVREFSIICYLFQFSVTCCNIETFENVLVYIVVFHHSRFSNFNQSKYAPRREMSLDLLHPRIMQIFNRIFKTVFVPLILTFLPIYLFY